MVVEMRIVRLQFNRLLKIDQRMVVLPAVSVDEAAPLVKRVVFGHELKGLEGSVVLAIHVIHNPEVKPTRRVVRVTLQRTLIVRQRLTHTVGSLVRKALVVQVKRIVRVESD